MPIKLLGIYLTHHQQNRGSHKSWLTSRHPGGDRDYRLNRLARGHVGMLAMYANWSRRRRITHASSAFTNENRPMTTMKIITTALAIGLTLSNLTTATPAFAWGGYYNNGGAVAGALISGFSVGSMVGAIAS